MKLLNIRTIEECLDQIAIKEYEFDSPVTKEFINYLGRDGILEYFKFARPFYRVTKNKIYILKGIEKATTLQVVYVKYKPEQQTEILVYFDGFISNNSVLNPNSKIE